MPSATVTDILIPGIMEHIERAGIHSGDSISVYPAPTINDKVVKETIAEYTRRLAKVTACHRTDQYPVHCHAVRKYMSSR